MQVRSPLKVGGDSEEVGELGETVDEVERELDEVEGLRPGKQEGVEEATEEEEGGQVERPGFLGVYTVYQSLQSLTLLFILSLWV